jgi:hypothetical protein
VTVELNETSDDQSEDTPTRLGTVGDVAALLGVSRNQAWTWAKRSERNGAPGPVTGKEVMINGRMVPRYDLDAWLAWHIYYVPARGGAPKGNQYALRHGRYSGTEARRTRSKVGGAR